LIENHLDGYFLQKHKIGGRYSMKQERMKMGLIVLAACASCFVARADLIVGYDFVGGSGAATSVDPDVSASGIGRVGWSISGSSGNLYIQNPSTVPTGAIDLGQYVSFAINPLLNTIDYDAVSVRLGGDNTTSTIDYTINLELRSSVDNYSSVLGTDSYTVLAGVGVNNLKPTVSILDLSGNVAFQGIDTTTTFRLYVFDDSDYNGTKIAVRLDDISAAGSVVPEPATMGMLGFGMLVVMFVRRIYG